MSVIEEARTRIQTRLAQSSGGGLLGAGILTGRLFEQVLGGKPVEKAKPPTREEAEYELLKPEIKEVLTLRQWKGISPEARENLLSGAGVGYEAAREHIKYVDEEGKSVWVREPGRYERGKVAVQFY